ncbi:MAG: HAMP domain-containing histidine kinase [Lachnospiraceae bacterium]|nr:HAMP domain-containing histidine kinase [Lachnospiraceae bacterium]
MWKRGKETRSLLYGISAVCVLALLLAYGISNILAKNFQQKMVTHDYGIAGYLLNHKETAGISAFTAAKSAEDIIYGSNLLSSVRYDETTPIHLLPEVSSYRNSIMLFLSLLLLFVFGTIYLILFFYLHWQHKTIQKAEISIRDFLDGNIMSRIESAETGDWYSFFHEVNELASILSAHAENERQTKEFLQNIISDVSHQIKTPLSALKMYQEIMDNRRSDAESISSFSRKSLREIKRIEEVVYILLKLAQLDAGIIQMQKTYENISVLIQDVLERFEILARQESKTITLSGKADVNLFCDALWLSEALGNIVKNALEHTVAGGQISIRWEQNALMTQIVIEDNGMGIHPEDLYNIFKRFYRSRFSQNTHGIGLGLPLAKTIVEIHGGTVSVTSKPGVGTVFTLNFYNLTKP